MKLKDTHLSILPNWYNMSANVVPNRALLFVGSQLSPKEVVADLSSYENILRAICWFLGCHEAKCSGYGEEKAAPNPMTDHLNSGVTAVPSEGL